MPKELTRQILDAGNWLPIERDTTRAFVELWLESGKEVTEGVAIADLTYWHGRAELYNEKVDGFRWFARRWKWSEKRTRNFFTKLDLMGRSKEGLDRQTDDNEGHSKGTARAQQGHSKGTANDENDEKTNNSGTARAQQGHSKGTVRAQPDLLYPARDRIRYKKEDRKEEERDARTREADQKSAQSVIEELSKDWTSDTLPIYQAFVEWTGSPPSSAMRNAVQLLLLPEGSPQGAKIMETAHYGKLFNGYTADQIVSAIEQFGMAGHHSPASLVKHVAGLIKPRTHGTEKPRAPSTADELRDKRDREAERQRQRLSSKGP